MLFLRLGLQAAALVCVVASAASWAAGFPPDIALARGVIAAMAVAVAGYGAELIVATTPERSGTSREQESEPSVPVALPLEGEVTMPDQDREAA